MKDINEINKTIATGSRVRIGTPTGNNFGTELKYDEHDVLSVELNPNNEYVPYSFMTCCDEYIPTSGMDGHWKNSIHYGSWEVLEDSAPAPREGSREEEKIAADTALAAWKHTKGYARFSSTISDGVLAAHTLGYAQAIRDAEDAVLRRTLENLPEERAIHGYMTTQGDGNSKDYCTGWNDYRLAVIHSLTSSREGSCPGCGTNAKCRECWERIDDALSSLKPCPVDPRCPRGRASHSHEL